MSAPKQKTEILIELMRAQDWKAALSLGSTFKAGFDTSERATLKRAHEAHHNARFYLQLKRCPEAMKAAGIAILTARYGARL